MVTRATSENSKVHGHPVGAITPIMCKTLLDAGFEVEISNNTDRIRNPDPAQGLNSFDAVLFHGKIEQPDDEAVEALRVFVEGGKGLGVVHIASASFTGSRPWLDLIGSAWVYDEGVYGPFKSTHPPAGPVTVQVTAPQHPIMAGLPSEFTFAAEELYQIMAPSEVYGPGTELARGSQVTEIGVAVEPVAFAFGRGRGRVFNLYPGHFVSTHRDWRFQKMVTQGLEWAAGR
jgi:hypothetical protein